MNSSIPKHAPTAPRRFYFFIAVWVLVMGSIAVLLHLLEVRRQEALLREHAEGVVAAVKNKLDANEAVLAGLSSFLLAVDQNDTEAVTRYAAAISAAYPHIYMLEVARRVPTSEREAFTRMMRTDWRPDFTIKNFPAITHQPAQATPPAPETWPILFMYPDLPQAAEIYGLSLETVPYLSYTLGLAKGNSNPVTSPVFTLYEGGDAYILLKDVDRSKESGLADKANFFGERMSAIVLVKTENLIGSGSDLMGLRITASMKSAALTRDLLLRDFARHPALLDTALLPMLDQTPDVGNETQPMKLHFQKYATWSAAFNLNSALLTVLYLSTLFAIPVLVHRHLRSVDAAAAEHSRSVYLATHDVLTELPNRYLFEDRFNHAQLASQRNRNAFAVLLIDIDDFKAINDTHGHSIGDEVLRTAARRMTAELRASDTLARYGGDEFMGLLESVASVEDAEKVADKLIDQFHELVITRTGPIRVSISIGIALCPQHGNNLDDLKTAADSAMYQAKKAGKNRSHSFKHLHAV